MKKLKLLTSLYLFGLLIATSCTKNNLNVNGTSKQQLSLYDKLLEIGFVSKDIKDIGEYYLVQGDMLFKKEGTDMEYLDNYFKQKTRPRQAVDPNRVSNTSIETMKINDGWSSGLATGEIRDWQLSARTAMQHWAGISNSKINFVTFYSPWGSVNNLITIVDDGGTLDNNIIAAAEWPSSGSPGWRIRVNTDFYNNYTVSEGQRIYNLVHEIGHCLGFHHTNFPAPYATQIPGTPSSDALSVMNGGTALNSWNGFSTYDVVAAQTIYPKGQYDNWLTSPEGGKYPGYGHLYLIDYPNTATITWNTSLVSTSTVTLQIYQFGTYVKTIASNIPNTGSYEYPLAQTDYTWNAYHAYELQVKIISDDNPDIFDYTSMFDVQVD
jgi:hypothetical protein